MMVDSAMQIMTELYSGCTCLLPLGGGKKRMRSKNLMSRFTCLQEQVYCCEISDADEAVLSYKGCVYTGK